MMKKNLMIFTVLFGLSLGGITHATVLTPNQWYEFRTVTGGATEGCLNNFCSAVTGTIQIANGPWTFTGLGVFEVNDGFTLIDRFEIFDFGVSQGLTSVPSGGNCFGNLANCLADAGASKGSFAMGAGAHSITINNTLQNAGAHFFRFNTNVAVPEPMTLSLLGLGLLGLGFGRKKTI